MSVDTSSAPARPAGTNRVQLIDWRPLHQASLRGFASIAVNPPGLVIHEVTLHRAGDRLWAGLPGRPLIDQAGKVLTYEKGKRQYSPVVEIPDRTVRDRLSDAVIALVQQRDPEALR